MYNKTIIVLLSIILIAIIIFGTVTLTGMDAKINEIKAQVVNLSNLSSGRVFADIDNLRIEIEKMIKKQGSIIAAYSLAYGKPDVTTLVTDVTLTVTPKEFSDNTSAVFYIADKKADMTRNGNVFTAAIPISITKNYNNLSVAFNQDGLTKSENIPEVINFGDMYKNCILAEPYGYEENRNGKQVSYTSGVNFSFNSVAGDQPVSAKFIAMYGGKTLWTQDLPKPGTEQKNYTIDYTLNTENKTPIEAFIEVIGSFGFTYRYNLGEIYTAEGPNPPTAMEKPDCKVFDKSGNEIIFDTVDKE